MVDEKPKSKAAPGWYKDPKKPEQDRRWDGEHWLEEWRSPPLRFGQRPEGFMVAGIALAIGLGLMAGAVLSVDDEGFGILALWFASVVAGTVFTIGVFGKAVEIGVRSARRNP